MSVNPLSFWNMSLVGDKILDPFGGVSLICPVVLGGFIQSVVGKIGNAVALDKSEGQILKSTVGVGNGIPVTINGSFFVWAWLKRPAEAVGVNLGYIMEAESDEGTMFNLTWDNEDTVTFAASGSSVQGVVGSDDVWHLLIAQYDSATDIGVIYVDNVIHNTTIEFGGVAGDTNGRIAFGTKMDESDNFDGSFYIDAVGVALGNNDNNEFEDILWNGGEGIELHPPGSLATSPSPSLL